MSARSATVIIGAGRMGRGLAAALGHRGQPVRLLGRDRRPDAARGVQLVLLAVPDGAVEPLAAELARQRAIEPQQVVLHLSGLLDRGALLPLVPTGAGLGSFHPLQTVAEPATAPDLLRGAYAGIEGDERALAAGEQLAAWLAMRPVRLAPGGKPAYHAGAVIASNYTVALAAVAEGLARRAGVSAGDARALYLPLMRGTLANLELGPVAALTGPIRRGDEATVRCHLAALAPAERRLYCELGRVTLALARQAGLPEPQAAAIERTLTEAG